MSSNDSACAGSTLVVYPKWVGAAGFETLLRQGCGGPAIYTGGAADLKASTELLSSGMSSSLQENLPRVNCYTRLFSKLRGGRTAIDPRRYCSVLLPLRTRASRQTSREASFYAGCNIHAVRTCRKIHRVAQLNLIQAAGSAS